MTSRRYAGLFWILVPLAVIIAFIVILFHSANKNGGETPALIRVGVLPDQGEELLKSQHEPLLNYLSREVGLEFKLVIPSSYDELVRRAALGEIDLAYFGGLTFIQAEAKKAVAALVMRDIDFNFVSYFFTRAWDSGHEIREFSGRKLGFGSSQSTSGHLMPRKFLKTMNIEPESFFSEVVYSGSHDRTVRQVVEGAVDLGVANAWVVERMIETGRIGPKSIRIIWKTPPYADYVWAIRTGISEELRMRILDAFLKLSRADPRHRIVLERQGAASFFPTGENEFAQLRQISRELGMVESETD